MGFGMGSPMGSPSSVVGATGRTGNKIPSGYKQGQLQNFTPEQMQLFQQLFSNVGPESFLSKLAGGDPSQFEQSEAPAQRQFSGTLGNIASRFSGMGMGGRHSSGFQNYATSAGSNFAQDLQSKRMELQRQAIMDLMGLSNNLLQQKPYENFMVKKESPWMNILGQFAGGIPGAVTSGLTGGLFGGGDNQAPRGQAGVGIGY